MVAVRRAGSTVTADIARVSISTPPSAPGIVPWPVARTATGRRWRAAKRTAVLTSASLAARTATSGTGMAARSNPAQAASNPGLPGR